MNYLQVEIESFDQQQKEILVALLSEMGYEGFEEDAGSLKAFIPEIEFNESILKGVVRNISYNVSVIEEKNWNTEWESNFQPVVIDDFCAIRAEFHQPVKNVDHEIIITPKMSFGTGHHPTTAMMIRMMREINFIGKKILDFGTGTGILAILAKKLGTAEIVAIDNDDWSIENANENFQKNNCRKIRIEKSSSIPTTEKFDIVLVNIFKTVILANLRSIGEQLIPGGVVLVSGLLKEDEKEILPAADINNFMVINTISDGNWICLKLQYE